MANQTERAELHKTIWKIANDLRGAVDGWEFKAYVLGSIFYRFTCVKGQVSDTQLREIESILGIKIDA